MEADQWIPSKLLPTRRRCKRRQERQKEEVTMRKLIFLFCWLPLTVMCGQEDNLNTLSFKEYLGFVKKYHPIAKQAELTMSFGQAELLKARGGFDPKIEVDYDAKQFKGTEYWDRLNATFKIPTYYGIELKGNFQQAEGTYINADETLPNNGLYSAGISMNLADGFWINERMADLKKAKFFREQTKADQDLLVNKVIFDASMAYFDWLKAYREADTFDGFLTNAKLRFDGIKRSALAGDKAIIDTVEAKIAVENRALSLEQARVKLLKSRLNLSNFLWINEVPVELQPGISPNLELDIQVDETLEIAGMRLDSFAIENHPKLRSLDFKVKQLEVDKRLKTNKILPKIKAEYNLITPTADQFDSYVLDNYKAGIGVEMPLFIRKERGALRLAKLKLQDTELERANAEVAIQNKIVGIYQELGSFVNQNQLIGSIISNYERMLAAEERKFSFGESSLFLINSRENKLIEAELKGISVENKYLSAKAKLFKSLAINPEL